MELSDEQKLAFLGRLLGKAAPGLGKGIAEGLGLGARKVLGAVAKNPAGAAKSVLFPNFSRTGQVGKILGGARNLSLGYYGLQQGGKLWEESGNMAEGARDMSLYARRIGMSDDKVRQLASYGTRGGLWSGIMKGSPLGRAFSGQDGKRWSDRALYNTSVAAFRDRLFHAPEQGIKAHEVLAPGVGLLSRGIQHGLGQKFEDSGWAAELARTGMDEAGKKMNDFLTERAPGVQRAISRPGIQNRIRGVEAGIENNLPKTISAIRDFYSKHHNA